MLMKITIEIDEKLTTDGRLFTEAFDREAALELFSKMLTMMELDTDRLAANAG